MVELKLIVARILYHYNIYTTDKIEDVPMENSILLNPVRGFKKQAWITAVLHDNDVPKALTLGRSLRRAVTSKTIAVLVSPKISVKFKDLLSQEFDSTHVLEEDRNVANLDLGDFAKLFSLTLRVFDKCVFLSPNMLAMKNCDEVFEKFHSLTFLENMDTSVFGLKPSTEIFRSLLTGLQSKNKNGGIEGYLKLWMKNQQKETKTLEPMYNRVISLQKTRLLLSDEKGTSIVNFVEDPTNYLPMLSESDTSLGLLEKLAITYWSEIYHQEVQPTIEAAIKGLSPSKELLPKVPQYEREPIAIIGMSCRLETYVYYLMLNALYECDWKPEKSQSFKFDSLIKQLDIKQEFQLFVRYFLEVFQNEGLLKYSKATDEWTVVQTPTPHDDVKITLKSPIYTEKLVKTLIATKIVARVGENMFDVLKGKVAPLNVLFPDPQKNLPTVGDFYENYGNYFNIAPSIQDILRLRVNAWNEQIKPDGSDRHGYIIGWASTAEDVLSSNENGIKLAEASSKPTWLVFTVPKLKLGRYLSGQLCLNDRNVVSVVLEGAVIKNGPTFAVREDKKEDFEALIKNIVAKKGTIEDTISQRVLYGPKNQDE
ncbi:unnamed protein product [Orchesella dallaii]|uniref:Uncharacterized protein n=1 Tax=Orchesella dallaii TaxID=48710 RepID=A0ABP1RAT2_9HEXA